MNKIPPPNAVSKIAPPPIPEETRFPDDTKVKVAMKDGREIEAVIMEYNKGTKLFAVMWEEGNVAHFEFVSAEQLTRVPTDEERGKVIPFTRGRIAKNLVPPSTVKTTAVPPPVPKSEAEQAIQEIVAIHEADEKAKERAKSIDILDGAGATSLYAGRKTYDVKNEQTDSVLEVVAATYEGYEYSKKHNQDRVLVVPLPNKAIRGVIGDGMGAGELGGEAAEYVVLPMRQLPPIEAAKKASEKMREEEFDGQREGAVFLSADIKVGQPIDVVQAGDADIMHFGSDGEIKFCAEDRLKIKDASGNLLPTQSTFELLMSDHFLGQPAEVKNKVIDGLQTIFDLDDAEVSIAKKNAANGQPLFNYGETGYYKLRKGAGNAITSTKCEPIQYKTNKEVQVGDIVILMSDGVSTNFNEKELQSFVIEVKKRKLTAEQATKTLSDELHKRMQQADGVNRFKRDNASIVVIFVNKLKAQEEAKESQAV